MHLWHKGFPRSHFTRRCLHGQHEPWTVRSRFGGIVLEWSWRDKIKRQDGSKCWEGAEVLAKITEEVETRGHETDKSLGTAGM